MQIMWEDQVRETMKGFDMAEEIKYWEKPNHSYLPGVDEQLRYSRFKQAGQYAVKKIRGWKGKNGDGDWEPEDLLSLRRNQ